MNSVTVFRNIIASGCSFSSNGLGGLPPTLQHPDGACSFIPDPDYQSIEPVSWTSILAKKINIKSFVNVAAASHGNVLVANNILTLINRFNYSAIDTLVLFNLSDPARMDVMCDWNRNSKSARCDWPDQVLPYGYIDRNVDLVKKTTQMMGVDQVELFTSNAILGMMSFLKHRGFKFYFTMMRDYRDNLHLGPVIQEFSDHLVTLSPGVGMYEHASILNFLADDNHHPNLEGYHSIALQVLNKIKE